jgi:translation initiation factor 2 beta subunit (eIF-2beta)/eIF-5
MRGRATMEEDNPCKNLLNKTFAETVTDGTFKKQLIKCLHKEVFKVDGLRLFYDEENTMFIEFTEHFFANQPDLQWREKPSDTRIEKFHEILKRLQRDFNSDFMVSGDVIPSSTNLNLKLRLALREFRKEKHRQLDSMPTGEIIKYLKWLWSELLMRLRNYGFVIE